MSKIPSEEIYNKVTAETKEAFTVLSENLKTNKINVDEKLIALMASVITLSGMPNEELRILNVMPENEGSYNKIVRVKYKQFDRFNNAFNQIAQKVDSDKVKIFRDLLDKMTEGHGEESSIKCCYHLNETDYAILKEVRLTERDNTSLSGLVEHSLLANTNSVKFKDNFAQALMDASANDITSLSNLKLLAKTTSGEIYKNFIEDKIDKAAIDGKTVNYSSTGKVDGLKLIMSRYWEHLPHDIQESIYKEPASPFNFEQTMALSVISGLNKRDDATLKLAIDSKIDRHIEEIYEKEQASKHPTVSHQVVNKPSVNGLGESKYIKEFNKSKALNDIPLANDLPQTTHRSALKGSREAEELRNVLESHEPHPPRGGSPRSNSPTISFAPKNVKGR